jgi:hypothetical protein
VYVPEDVYVVPLIGHVYKLVAIIVSELDEVG